MALSDEDIARRRSISIAQVRMLRERRGLTDDALELIPDTYIRRAVRRLDYPDMPRARRVHRLAQSRDGQGLHPAQALIGVLRQLDSVRVRAPRAAVAGIPTGGLALPSTLSPAIAPAALAGLGPAGSWIPLGPGNIGGRTRSILTHPSRPDTLWAASAAGGVWRTDDGGRSWLPVDDFLANLAVTSLVMDPTNSNVIYAATGEGFGNLDAIRGAGIFQTLDGTTWSILPATSIPELQSISRLAISVDGAVLLAATNNGIYRSSDPARAKWSKVLPAAISDVKFHPTDAAKAVAGSMSSGSSWYSTDGGVTWSPSTHAQPWSRRVEVCYARANPNTVYASVDNGQGQIWRSTNGGRSFTVRKTLDQDGQPASYLGDQGWYGNVIWAGDPVDPNFVIVGGIDLWRSTDGGNALVDISTWWDSRSAHADHHAIVAHANYNGTSNRVLFFGNDGGVYRADDASTVGNDPAPPRIAGWTDVNNSYGVTQFYSGAANVTTGVIMGGAQDNGTLAYRPGAGQNWNTVFGGDGGFCAADPNDQNVFYGEYVYLNIHRNTDAGTTSDSNGDRYISGQFWNQVTQKWDWKPFPYQIPDAFNQRALFIAPFVLDPNESNRILAGGESLWRTDDAKTPNTPTSGPSWAQIKSPAAGFISAIAVAQGNPGIVWVGYDSGEIWKSTNATSAAPSWARLDGQGQNPVAVGAYCARILISPAKADSVLVCFSRYAAGNLWRTDDGGTNWMNIGSGLPAAPLRAIAVHPTRQGWLYAGTEVGVFASENNGQTWSPSNEGPANVSVDDLFWMGTTLICVTHGRGMFKINIP